MTVYISNSFSLSMLPLGDRFDIEVRVFPHLFGPCSEPVVRQLLADCGGADMRAGRLPPERPVSAIGHEATASVAQAQLLAATPTPSWRRLLEPWIAEAVVPNRIKIELREEDVLYVLQLTERLPEGKVLSEEELARVPAFWARVRLRRREIEPADEEFHWFGEPPLG